MSYQSKYTGNEIDELLDKVKSGSASKVELWSGELINAGDHVTLSSSLEYYDYLLIYANYEMSSATGKKRYLPVTMIATEDIKNTYGSGSKFVSTVFTDLDSSIQLYWGFDSDVDFNLYSVNKFGQVKTAVTTKVVGIKLGESSIGDSAPTGNIISFMGTKAPNGYLVCDGAELEISKYAKLAAHFEEQFGTKNHFGGNGTTTFAVPDLRNEFLRGYHGNKDKQLSGEIGIHQEGTYIPHFYLDNTNNNFALLNKAGTTGNTGFQNTDEAVKNGIGELRFNTFSGYDMNVGTELASHQIVRPTNIAVLYCIKY